MTSIDSASSSSSSDMEVGSKELMFREWWAEIQKAGPSRLDVALAAWRMQEAEVSRLRAQVAELFDEAADAEQERDTAQAEVERLQADLEHTRQIVAAQADVLQRIAVDYYHDRHAIWAGEVLRARLDAADVPAASGEEVTG